MKAKYTGNLYFLVIVILLSPVNAFAQLFGSEEESWSKVYVELKKINTSLVACSTQNQLNQKLIEILQEDLKQGVETKSLLDSFKKDMEITHASMNGENEKNNRDH